MTTLTREMFGDAINWELWDKLVAQTKLDIAESLKHYTAVTRHGIGCYAYNSEGQVYKFYPTLKSLSEDITGASMSTISRYVKSQEIYNGYLLSRTEIPKDIAKEIYKEKLTSGKCYFSCQGVNTKHCKRVYKYNKDGALIGVYDSLTIFIKRGGIHFKNDTIHNGFLISKKLYTADVAKKNFRNNLVD